MDREKSLAKNTIILAFGTFLPKLSSFITLPIITGGLTKSEMGKFDLIGTLVSLFLPVVTLQIQTAAFRFLIDCRDNEKETKRIITNIIAFVIPSSLAALCILYLFLFKLSFMVRLFICLYFFADILLLAAQQIVRGLSNNKLYSISTVVTSLVNMIFIILTISMWNLGLTGILLSLMVSSFAGLFILLHKGNVIANVDLHLVSKSTLRNMIHYSWPLIPNSLSGWVLNLSDRTLITLFIGLEANAVYSVANKIPSLFSLVQDTFAYAWQENASLASGDSDADVYYAEMFNRIYGILVGIMALLIAATPVLFKILIRGDYGEAYFQMPILLMGMLFSSLSSFMGGIYVAHKKTRSVGITTIIAAITNLLIDFILIQKIKIFAASISTLISYIFLVLYRMYDVQKFQQIKFDLKRFSFFLMILIIMCVNCWMNHFALNVLNIFFGMIFAVLVNRKVIEAVFQTIKTKIHR